MKSRFAPPWLKRLAAWQVVVALIAGIVCALIGAFSLTVGRAPGEPINLVALVWDVAIATLAAGLLRQFLRLATAAQRLVELNVELARTNATLSEGVAASRAMRQEMARQKMLAENLLAVARATSQRPLLEATLQNTLSICVALTGATDGTLFLMDANGQITRHLLAKQDVPLQEARSFVGRAMTEGLAGWAVKNRQVGRVADTATDPRWVPLPDVAHIRSAMAIPLMSRNATAGVITLMHTASRHFTEEHERLLADAADQVGVALDNAQMFEQMTRLTDRLSLLYEISQEVRQLDLEAALAKAVRAIRATTGWPNVAALLFDHQRNSIARTSVGGESELIETQCLPSGERLVDLVISTASAQRTREGAPVMAAPIHIGQRVIGALGACSQQPDGFTDQDMEFLSSVADTLAMAAAYSELSHS
jgi:GAF domain-containing protein